MNRTLLVCKQLFKSKPIVESIKRHVISSQAKKTNLLKMEANLPKIIFVLGAPGKKPEVLESITNLITLLSFPLQVLAKELNARKSSTLSVSLICLPATCCVKNAPVMVLSLEHSSKTTSLMARSCQLKSLAVCLKMR